MIVITDTAKEKIQDVLIGEDPNSKLRMFVQGGGCAGFSYGFTIDTEQNDDDFVIEAGNASVIVDSMSMQYIDGSTVDYVEELMGAHFSIKNPQSATTCGCGSSFSI